MFTNHNIKKNSLLIHSRNFKFENLYVFSVLHIDEKYFYIFTLKTNDISKQYKIVKVKKDIIDFYNTCIL